MESYCASDAWTKNKLNMSSICFNGLCAHYELEDMTGPKAHAHGGRAWGYPHRRGYLYGQRTFGKQGCACQVHTANGRTHTIEPEFK